MPPKATARYNNLRFSQPLGVAGEDLIMRLARPARIRFAGRDCRTTKMRKRDVRAVIAANAAQIRLCVKISLLDWRKVLELAAILDRLGGSLMGAKTFSLMALG